MDEMDTKNPNSGMSEDYMYFMQIPREPKGRSTLYHPALISSFRNSRSLPDKEETKASGFKAQERLLLHP
jgi:hypothetical protein